MEVLALGRVGIYVVKPFQLGLVSRLVYTATHMDSPGRLKVVSFSPYMCRESGRRRRTRSTELVTTTPPEVVAELNPHGWAAKSLALSPVEPRYARSSLQNIEVRDSFSSSPDRESLVMAPAIYGR